MKHGQRNRELKTRWDWLNSNMEKIIQDPNHARQVVRLALMIYDQTASLIKTEKECRCLLELAGWLHDTGVDGSDDENHHKVSYKKIIQFEVPDLTQNDRILVALIARYHRKSEPDGKRHEPFNQLSDDDKNLVEWMAGILRIADGLDRTHQSLVNSVDIDIQKESIVVSVKSDSDIDAELSAASKKSSLFSKKSGRIVRIL